MKTAHVLLWFVLAASLVFPTGVLPAAGPAPGFAIDNGDVNGDGARNLSDAVSLLSYSMLGGAPPVPLALCEGNAPAVRNGDIDGSGRIDITDAVRLLTWLFFHVRPPVPACKPGEDDFRVLGLNVIAYGRSYGQWSAEFWKWAFSLPVDHHPLFDTADCSYGQSGKVWFLGASFSPSVTTGGDVIAFATRDCTVPAKTALFFPIANAEASTMEGNGETLAELSAAAKGFQDLATNMSCEIDGVPVKDLDSYRVQSPPYVFGPLPENNIPQAWGLGTPAGTTSLSVADGVHLLLPPLSVGKHTLHFHAEVPEFHFYLDITYNLTVASGH